ncbi:MAG: type II toxin-antitoxin system RelE/ParE family toxin [Candidatus Omnitrophica bacterium]|nr:type II toxin-antitoxin system RelE/ParE family toxin [Candidatus Omnitrophota bacterium]MCA9441668.1 type II toxin-antitoxin system RelE/ParE family toxin [Candidatus Omnitrophota bacterium]
MTFSFHRAAKRELDEAVEYYEDCRLGLGYEFHEEIYRTISRILEYPEAWTQISPRTRRCLTKRFPYGVIYQIKEDRIRVIAVAHSSRRPRYWSERVED